MRPLSGIVAIFGDDLVECSIDGVTSGFETVGHRFHHDGMITIGNAGDYTEKLRACHVIVDHEERAKIIRNQANKLADDHGLELVEDEALVVENAGLTEWPVPLMGGFDEIYLDLPPEVIQLTTRINQKYFICRRNDDELSPSFICVANLDASDGGDAIVAGNEKVIEARLADAKFFWELDQKTPLEDHAKKLSNIVFHEKLGTVADKVERVAKLAEWLVSLEGNGFDQSSPGDALHSEVSEAARLCKADLVTEMVGEFPDLQGLMGGYYAEKQVKSAAVANAIRDHYKPAGQGDEVPTDPVTVAVSLADKLDTLFQFFAIGEKPTGSKDPYALRRAALGIIALSRKNDLRWNVMLAGIPAVGGKFWRENRDQINEPILELVRAMTPLISQETAKPLFDGLAVSLKSIPKLDEFDKEAFVKTLTVSAEVRDFLTDRLDVACREDGIRIDLIRASVSVGGEYGKEDDLVRLLARVKALQAFVETGDGENLLAGYKRASNILKKEEKSSLSSDGEGDHPKDGGGGGSAAAANAPPSSSSAKAAADATSPSLRDREDLGYDPEPAEKALIEALDAAEPQVTAAIEAEDFEKAMTSLAALRAPIDQFFDDVTVNDDDPAKREARLALLARFRDAVHQVADFSKIEG